jgi:hypothetical protein
VGSLSISRIYPRECQESFYDSIGSRQREASEHRLVVARSSLGQALYFRTTAVGHMVFPLVQPMALTPAYDLPKRLHEPV